MEDITQNSEEGKKRNILAGERLMQTMAKELEEENKSKRPQTSDKGPKGGGQIPGGHSEQMIGVKHTRCETRQRGTSSITNSNHQT